MDVINQEQTANETVAYWIEQAEALERIEKNPDFQKVIEESYTTTSTTRPTINKRYPSHSVMFETDTGKQIYNNNGVWEYIVTA